MNREGRRQRGANLRRNDDLHRVLALLGSPEAGRDRYAPPALRSTSYLRVPPVGSPKLLLPADMPEAGAEALRLWAAAQHRWHRRLAYQVGAACLNIRPLHELWPNRWAVTDTVTDHSDHSLTSRLGTLLGQSVVVAANVGRRDPHQSQLLIALNEDGTPLAYVKVGWNDLNRRLLRNEARALRRVAELGSSAMVTPSVLHSERWNNLELLLTAPVERSRQRAASRSQPPALPITLEVAATGMRERLPLRQSRYWSDLRLRLAAAAESDQQAARVLERAVATLDAAGDKALGFAGWHGDWVPWNLSYDRDQLLVWDWEYWSEGAPVGFDILHFFFGTQFFRGGGDVITAWNTATIQSRTRLGWLGVDNPALPLVHALYAVEMLARRLDIRNHGGGGDDDRVFPQIYSLIQAAVSAV